MVTELDALAGLTTQPAPAPADAAGHLTGEQWAALAQFADQWQRLSGHLVGQGVPQWQLDSLATPMLTKLGTKLSAKH